MNCNVCQNFDLDDLINRLGAQHFQARRRQHHANFSDLQASANQGCPLCSEITSGIFQDRVDEIDPSGRAIRRYDGINDPTLPSIWRILPIILEAKTWHHPSNLHFIIACGTNQAGSLTSRFKLGDLRLYLKRTPQELNHGLCDSSHLLHSEILGRNISLYSDSEDVFKLANLWLNQCLGQAVGSSPHALCHPPSLSFKVSFTRKQDGEWVCNGPVPMPVRTINVGPSDGSQQPFLAIHGSAEHAPRQSLPWATLSHCWGPLECVPKTTLENIESYMKEIRIDLLPQTFQDAIRLTRVLGIRHLWIDSLCILQDSEIDWAVHALSMAEVYRHALINIAPCVSTGPESGFLNKIRTAVQNDREVTFKSSKYDSVKLWVGKTHGIWSLSIMSDPRTAPYERKLHSRGWVLQETLLAPRTLHFGSEQLFWECCERVQSEGCMVPLHSIYERPVEGRFLCTSYMEGSWKAFLLSPPVGNLESATAKRQHRRVLYHRWYTIVYEYSRRKLTFKNDLFPALSGIAQTMQRMLGDKYVAGVFDGDLARGLLWTHSSWRKTSISAKPLKYRAPSWSWASRYTSFHWDRGLLEDLLTDHDSTDHIPYPVFLHHQLTPVLSSVEPSEQQFGAIKDGHLVVRTMVRPATDEDFLFKSRPVLGKESTTFDNGRLGTAETMQMRSDTMHLAYMGIFNSSVYALILVPTEQGTFRRIGVFVRPADYFFDTIPTWTTTDITIV